MYLIAIIFLFSISLALLSIIGELKFMIISTKNTKSRYESKTIEEVVGYLSNAHFNGM